MNRLILFTIFISSVMFFISCNNRMGNMGTTKSEYKFDNSTFNKLAIPSILEPTVIDGVNHYDLKIQKGVHSFFKDVETKTFGVNGGYLGPTLILKNGEKVSLDYTNLLGEPTTMHGHGMHVPAKMDGTPHQKIKSGDKWSAVYTVKQRAATNWYHPHLMGKTAEHVYKGLAGLLIVEDDEINSLDIPKTYGVDDIPLVLQDRFFDSKGQINYSPSMMEIMHGYHGDIFITNGVINAYIDLEAKEVRLRLLNGSNSTVYDLKFKDNRSFKQIATDNSLLESPVTLNHVLLSPGERAEIIVDLTDLLGKSISLIDSKTNNSFLKININKEVTKLTHTPDKLTKLDFYDIKNATKQRDFVLSGSMGEFYINNRSMDMNYINEIVPLDKVEIWTAKNTMGMEHNFHIHATHFIVLERNGSKSNVLDNEKGYKDTVYLAPGDSVKLLVKMTDYADPDTPYMYHCHFLEHEDNGMMGQFTVIK